MRADRVTIFTDGASRNNPGPAAIGVIIKDEQGKTIARLSRAIGHATNNQAEYRAVIAALEEAVRRGASNVTLNSDSELLVRQLNGRYRVKNPALKPLFQQVINLQQKLESLTVRRIPREQNREADALANAALTRV